MSTDPIDVVRAVSAAAEQGDLPGVEGYVAPHALLHGTVGGEDEALLLHGPAAAVDYLTDRTETSMTWRLKAEELHPVRDGVVVFWRETSHGPGGEEVVKETAMWFLVRDGLIVEARRYLDRAQAVADAQAY